MAQAKNIDIPSEDLRTALNDYIQQSGVQLVYNSSDVSGLRSRAVHGVYGPAEALNEMLGGTGIAARHDASGAVVVAKLPDRRSENYVPPMGTQVAQVASDASSGAREAAVEEVVVTGSRLGNAGFTSPTPVTQISPIVYELKEATSMDDVIFDIPSLTPTLNYNASTNVGIDNFNLRNLGGTRTLVLVDGVRTAPTDSGGLFDVGIIPSSLVQHMDIVTGGASAGYGSDAVAGMVNVTLNTSLNGFKGNFSAGIGQYGDERVGLATAAYGSDFLGGRGHIVFGVDYYSNSGAPWQNTHPYGKNSPAVIANPACTTITNTCFMNVVAFNVKMSNEVAGGVIVSAGPLQWTQFGAGGIAEPFVRGAYAGSTFMVGGDGSDHANDSHLQPSLQRANILIHDTYDLTDNVTLWSEFLYGYEGAFFPAFPEADAGTELITRQNAYLPASVATIMDANKITSFLMGRENEDVGGPMWRGFYLNYGAYKDYQASGGLKGKFTVGSEWDWDLTGQFSTNNQHTQVGQNLITGNWTNAIDSVLSAGKPVCRSTLTNPTNGCVAVNLFGPNTVTPAVQQYVAGTSWTDQQFDQYLVDLNLRGAPFSTWAGPVSLAVGGEVRRQSQSTTSDAISNVGGWKNANAVPYKGAINVQEAYLETDIPLAKGLPLAQALDINAAARLTSYSTSGGVATWKVGINYSPTDEVRFRGTRSHDIRAPNTTELYQTGVLRSGGTVINPITNIQYSPQTLTTGNPNLVPEIGDTITGGVVYSPGWLDGFNISFDYWNIRISHAIAAVGAQQVVNNCYTSNLPQYCSAITTGAGGAITLVASTSFNAALLKTDGFDLEAGYTMPMDDLMGGWDGTLQLSLLGTYLNNYISNAFGVITNQAGCVAACSFPHLRYDITGIYLNDPWQVSTTLNWMGGGEYSYLYSGRYTQAQGGATISNNKVDGRFTINTTVSYQWNRAWQVYGKIQNLANAQPPLTPGTTIQPFAASSRLYDRIGRTFTLGFKLSL